MSLFTRPKAFTLKDIEQAHFNVTYKGVPALKCPFDYVIYQMIMWEVMPDLVIEIGTNKGGGTLYLADLMDHAAKGEIHSIDIATNVEDALLGSHPRVRLFKNGFQAYDTSLLKKYSTILVIDDGSHMYEDVLAALKMFSPFVSLGSYYIVEDGIIDALGFSKEFHGGPLRAIEEFVKDTPGFLIDKKWSDFFGPSATFNVNGYLKRLGR
jgi:cephalosporin hydroxylase